MIHNCAIWVTVFEIVLWYLLIYSRVMGISLMFNAQRVSPQNREQDTSGHPRWRLGSMRRGNQRTHYLRPCLSWGFGSCQSRCSRMPPSRPSRRHRSCWCRTAGWWAWALWRAWAGGAGLRAPAASCSAGRSARRRRRGRRAGGRRSPGCRWARSESRGAVGDGGSGARLLEGLGAGGCAGRLRSTGLRGRALPHGRPPGCFPRSWPPTAGKRCSRRTAGNFSGSWGMIHLEPWRETERLGSSCAGQRRTGCRGAVSNPAAAVSSCWEICQKCSSKFGMV